MISITVNKELEVQQRLLKRAANGKLLRPILMSVAEEAIDLVKQGFIGGYAPDGTPWAPLKRMRRRDSGGKGQPLRDTGRLMNSLGRDGPGGYLRFTETGFTYGTNVSYAPHHQFGTSGHKVASSRNQPVNEQGKFIKRSQAALHQGSSVNFRTLNFTLGGGAIPARPFLPTDGIPASWQRKFSDTIRESFDALTRAK